MRQFPFRLTLVLCSVLLGVGPAAFASLEISVAPETGPLDGVFTLTLRNLTGQPIHYDGCAVPQIIAVADGREIYCPEQNPACAPAVLPDGGSLEVTWRPLEKPCPGSNPAPGICEVRWKGFAAASPARVELYPEGSRSLQVTAEPAQVRIGEKVRISVKNTAGLTLSYNRCCYPPVILDPRGRSTFCNACPECFQVVDFVEGEVLTSDWTPGRETCEETGELPGRHRVVCGGFFDGFPGSGPQYFGEVEVLVLPPEDRRLDLTLSANEVEAGGTLTLTAQNPLRDSVWRAPCCDEPILIDALGRQRPCAACTLECAPVRNQEIVPGGTVSLKAAFPDGGECGLEPGRWSVIWGPNFALVDGAEPAPPVFGYAEVSVLPPPGREFVRGNCDGSGALDITDTVRLLGYLFLGDGAPPCLEACDGDDSGALDITDAVAVLSFLFQGGPAPPAPFPAAGSDPTPDRIGCSG